MPFGSLIHRHPVRRRAVARHPMRSAAAAMLDAERAFDEIQRQFARYPTLQRSAWRFEPRIEAVEEEDHYRVRAELPGVEAGDLEVVVEEGVLTIKGSRALGGVENGSEDVVDVTGAEQGSEPAERTEDEVDAAIASEAETFERRIRFNAEIDKEAIKARYRNGLLTVTIPKQRAPEPVSRSIPVQVA